MIRLEGGMKDMEFGQQASAQLKEVFFSGVCVCACVCLMFLPLIRVCLWPKKRINKKQTNKPGDTLNME